MRPYFPEDDSNDDEPEICRYCSVEDCDRCPADCEADAEAGVEQGHEQAEPDEEGAGGPESAHFSCGHQADIEQEERQHALENIFGERLHAGRGFFAGQDADEQAAQEHED